MREKKPPPPRGWPSSESAAARRGARCTTDESTVLGGARSSSLESSAWRTNARGAVGTPPGTVGGTKPERAWSRFMRGAAGTPPGTCGSDVLDRSLMRRRGRRFVGTSLAGTGAARGVTSVTLLVSSRTEDSVPNVSNVGGKPGTGLSLAGMSGSGCCIAGRSASSASASYASILVGPAAG